MHVVSQIIVPSTDFFAKKIDFFRKSWHVKLKNSNCIDNEPNAFLKNTFFPIKLSFFSSNKIARSINVKTIMLDRFWIWHVIFVPRFSFTYLRWRVPMEMNVCRYRLLSFFFTFFNADKIVEIMIWLNRCCMCTISVNEQKKWTFNCSFKNSNTYILFVHSLKKIYFARS